MRSQKAGRSKLCDYLGHMLDCTGKIIIYLLKPIHLILYRPGIQMIGLGGMHGWLIVVGIVIIIWPMYICARLMLTGVGLFSAGVWQALTTPGNKAYVPFFGPTLLLSIILYIALLAGSIYLIFLFFWKKTSFPRWSIGVAIFSFLTKLIDGVAAKVLIPGEWVKGVTVWELGSELLKWFVACAIWVSYMLVSKRVKATFVK